MKATQLGGGTGICLEPYCVLEVFCSMSCVQCILDSLPQVDDPSQKHQSRAGSGPEFTWNDSFNVELGPASCEVLFEVIQCYVCCELN